MHVEVEVVVPLRWFDAGIRSKRKCAVNEIRGRTRNALRRVEANESTILLGDLNAHGGNEAGCDWSTY